MTIFRIHLFQFFNKIRIIRQCLVYFSKNSRFICFTLAHMHICAHFNKNIQKNKVFGHLFTDENLVDYYKIQSDFNVSTQDLQRRSEFLRYTRHCAFQTLLCLRIRTKRHTRQCRKYVLRLCRTCGRQP